LKREIAVQLEHRRARLDRIPAVHLNLVIVLRLRGNCRNREKKKEEGKYLHRLEC
jgi:hypothetical protein